MQPAQPAHQVQRVYMLPQVENISPPPDNMVIGKARSQWSTIRHMTGLVLVCFFLMSSLMIIPMGLMESLPGYSLAGALCSLPLLMLFIYIRRPHLIHVMIAEPDEAGSTAHPLPGERTLLTPVKTSFRHHLMRDSTLLDMPTTKNLWFVFSFSIATAIALFVLLFAQPDNDLLWVLATLVAIPCWLVGFAIPVFAWWSYSTRCLGLPTRRHEAESVLSAGFLSTFPAVVINSFLFPLLLMVFTIEPTGQLGEFLIVTISAPVGEELCKAAAVLACYRLIDSPRRGFQIGFTVGLGFAMLENILYITSSFSMGYAGFATTAFVRGIGSIPGHAIWTGLSGLGIGWALHRQPDLGGMLPQKQSAPTADFVLFNAKTGQSVDDATGTGMTMWNLNQIKQGRLSENPWALPSTAMTGLVLAILGHAFWNGSVTAVSYLAIKTLGEALGMLIMIVYTFAMIGALLWAGRNIMRSLPSVPGS